jgi:DNA-binding protein Fis
MHRAAARHKGIHSLRSAEAHESPEKGVPSGKSQFIEYLTLTLFREVQSLSEIPVLDIEQGIDLYKEVSDFEKSLIERVLLHTGCHQVRAASLLNLKPTTLNTKIKHYGINLDELMAGYNAIFKAKGLNLSS